tara:strand:+ start:297 stop:689 length:393 start_codon:yes stop_codon:yes gene_type:complete
MAFKLGGKSGRLMSGGQLKTNLTFNQDDASVPGTPVLRKDLEKGVLGEANDDGTIFINEKVQPGSEQEKEILLHEMVHMTDMKTGKLGYTDNSVTYMGETFPRQKGHIFYNEQWLPEGDKMFPWEQMPWE